MTAAWPGSLPHAQFLGLGLTMKPAIIESEVDVGQPTSRAIYSGTLEDVDCPIVVTGQQLLAFRDWFRDDIGNGALPFLWQHPATDVSVRFAFRAEAIRWRLDEGGDANGSRLWSTTLPLRILPT